MELLHHVMLVCIDREHGERNHLFARGRVRPAVPQAGNGKGRTRGQLDSPPDCFAGFVRGFIKIIDQHQPKLSLSPCATVARLFSRRLASGVVGVPTDLVVLGPRGNQTKFGRAAGHTPRAMALDGNGGIKTWIRLVRKTQGQVNAQRRLDPFGVFGGGEIGAQIEDVQSNDQ